MQSYSQKRNDIKDGDIVFIHKKSTLTSFLIAAITRSKFTHVGIAFWMRIQGTTQRRLMIVEAQRSTKRRVINMSFYSNRGLTLVASPKEWIGYSEKALSNLGKIDYSWLDVLYVGFREFLSKWITIKHRDFSGEMCSEYVAELLDFDEVSISPQLLFSKLLDRGEEIRMELNQ